MKARSPMHGLAVGASYTFMPAEGESLDALRERLESTRCYITGKTGARFQFTVDKPGETINVTRYHPKAGPAPRRIKPTKHEISQELVRLVHAARAIAECYTPEEAHELYAALKFYESIA